MRLAHDHVRVEVPATSANLGPGFDAMGLALAHHDVVDVRALGSAEVTVEVTGEGAGQVPTGEDHLVVHALRTALEHVGAPQTGLHLRCHNRVPHGRGMGSSAAAVVAGLLAARMLVSDPEALDDATVLMLATRLEGHPDNAAPALLGGATVAWETPSGPRAAVLPLHDDVVPVVLVPDERCATRTARGVLPAQVPHADAAFTAGRAALLVHALCHEPSLLLEATAERLHQDYRASVMRPTWELVRALRAEGLPAVVSGAGPSVLVLTRGTDGDAAGEVLDRALGARDTGGATAAGWRVLAPGVAGGARAVRLG
ncbi:homoserine kinase [Cellulomonas carbonis]|uniref:Homoserine kinase n=1 Tax=Cellulomonas carbonis T26 TaxID=947969 RepID=A0A0A0BR48_9CELL|nr:homoserine kinase [Cellulomonas carbonis]KGM10425.1 serine kinase [Cellulomonas carbonis T26]GGC11936.1 homoserine kinase [Cellulomonas carbonis]